MTKLASANRPSTTRPSRNEPPPGPAINGSYCLDCARLMPAPNTDSSTPRKYCSAACRSRSKDKSKHASRAALAHTFYQLLNEEFVGPDEITERPGSGVNADGSPLRAKAKGLETERARQKAKAVAKGGMIVLCSEAEAAAPYVRINSDGEGEDGDASSEEQEQEHDESESPERSTPLDMPDQREEARRAARRLVNFGWQSQGIDDDRTVEAVQGGKVVEASFAKGEWGIRWADRA